MLRDRKGGGLVRHCKYGIQSWIEYLLSKKERKDSCRCGFGSSILL